jgi:hypothetical protein
VTALGKTIEQPHKKIRTLEVFIPKRTSEFDHTERQGKREIDSKMKK